MNKKPKKNIEKKTEEGLNEIFSQNCPIKRFIMISDKSDLTFSEVIIERDGVYESFTMNPDTNSLSNYRHLSAGEVIEDLIVIQSQSDKEDYVILYAKSEDE